MNICLIVAPKLYPVAEKSVSNIFSHEVAPGFT